MRKKFGWLAVLVPMILASCSTPGGNQHERQAAQERAAWAAWEEANPQYDSASEFRWTRWEDGVIIIGRVGNRTEIRIPSQIQGMPVTGIGRDFHNFGRGAFDGNRLTSVTIPDSITYIGRDAFRNNQLTSVTIPHSVTYISERAFSQNQLASVIIPDSVTHIGGGAFQNNQLTSITIPDSVTHIGYGAFANNQLTSVSIPGSVTYIGYGAFANNQLTSVSIPGSVTYIGYNAFRNNQLAAVIIPDAVTHIRGGAFHNNQLTNVIIPDSVTYIGYNAFRNNQLAAVIIPDAVTHIRGWAFYNNHLTNVIISDSVEHIGNNAFARNQLASIPMTAQQRQASQAHRAEQVRLAGVYQQTGPSVGNLAFTVWNWSFSLLGIHQASMLNLGHGTFTRGFRVGLNPYQVIATGTFRVAGNTVIFRNSAGVYEEGDITGYTLRLGNETFGRL